MHLPSGTVTFLFTDIEGSARLWEEYPLVAGRIVERHYEILGEQIEARGGRVFKTVGDAVCAVFADAVGAAAAALSAQLALCSEQWEDGVSVRVRMAVHVGVAEERDGDYFGAPLNRCARLMGSGHGGQILMSQAAYELVRDTPPDGASFTDLGQHRLRDLRRPERIVQLSRPDLPSEFAALRSLDVVPNNLPAETTTFIGRENELAEIRGLLEETRLLTLTGPGGAGKTRLALHVAETVLDEFEHGVWFASAESAPDAMGIPRSVAETLGAHETPGRSATEVLVEHLRHRTALLILDNCEHLVEACAELVDALMAGCPDLRIIATSRETLRIPGEVWWPVPPLGIPDGQSEGSVGDYDAVQLFVDRAAAVRKGFAVTQGNAADIAELCRQLDGIPLAIELAAARLDILDAGQILERLDQRFRLLTQGSRTAPGRHRTLEAAISSSHDLLDEPERVLFRRLSVFAGEFSLSAAEQACGGDPIDEFEVIERLSSLRRKSLVEVAQPTEGAARYRMLGSLREYGRERLVEADELDEISARHAGHYLTRAEEAHPHLYGRGRRAWLEALELEMDNLRAAMSWALANDSAIAGRFAASLGEFWYVRGHWNEGRDLLEQTLALGDALDAGIRAKALLFAGRFAYRQVDYPRAAALGEEALKLSRAADEPRDVAGALRLLGDIAWGEERLDDAREHAAESLAISREVDDQRGIAASLTSLATVAGSRGDNDLSLSLTDESLVIWRALGDDREVAGGLSRLGGVALGQGRIEEARACYIESLDLFRDAGDQSDAAMALNSLGEVALRQGESEQAHACFSEGEETLTKLGDPRGVCWSRGGLARAATIRGDHEASRAYWAACVGPLREVGYPRGIAVSKLGFADACRALDDWDGALDAYRESLEIARSLDDPVMVGDLLARFAAVAQGAGNSARAAQLFGAVAALREAGEVAGRSDPGGRIALAREACEADSSQDDWDAGRAMSLADAVDHALGRSPDTE